MGQQPKVEITDSARPRPRPQPGPSLGWRSGKPGIPLGPEDVPVGGPFGHIGPDPGWALRLIADADFPEDDPRLKAVVTGLVRLRASVLGRAPVREDIEVALLLCGYAEDADEKLIERRRRWLAAVPHETRAGETAAAEVDRDLIARPPEQVRYALKHHRPG